MRQEEEQLTVFLLGLLFFAGAVSCKPLSTSQTNAIVASDGQAALGLIPLRQYYAVRTTETQLGAAAVENAIRLTDALVLCQGSGATEAVNQLEEKALLAVGSIQRNGPALVDANGNGLSLAADCAIAGKYLLGAAAFLEIFDGPPKTRADFRIKQALWLGKRGKIRTNFNLRVSFNLFLFEGLGEMVGGDHRFGTENRDLAIRTLVKQLDALYNPCDPGQGGQFDKNEEFSCREGNFVVGNFIAAMDELGTRIEAVTNQLIEDFDQLQGDDKAMAFGFAEGWRVASDLTTLQELSGSSPSIGALSPTSSRNGLQKLFQDRTAGGRALFLIGDLPSQRAQVIARSNPRTLMVPPDIRRASSGFNLAPTRSPAVNGQRGLEAFVSQIIYKDQNLGPIIESSYTTSNGQVWHSQASDGIDARGRGYQGTYYFPPAGTNAPIEWQGDWGGVRGTWVLQENGKWRQAQLDDPTGTFDGSVPVNGMVYNPNINGFVDSQSWGSSAGGFQGIRLPNNRGSTEIYQNQHQQHMFVEGEGWYVRNVGNSDPNAGWIRATVSSGGVTMAMPGIIFEPQTGEFIGRGLNGMANKETVDHEGMAAEKGARPPSCNGATLTEGGVCFDVGGSIFVPQPEPSQGSTEVTMDSQEMGFASDVIQE